MSNDFFPRRPEAQPTVYAYELVGVETHKGLLKVGYTTRGVRERVQEQLGTAAVSYRIVLEEPAMRSDGTAFTDHEVHEMLRINGVRREAGEWFRCAVEDVKAAIVAVRHGQLVEERRHLDFKMRPEQEEAVAKTEAYFKSYKRENNKPPHFLWNCKMRFGKTFAAYQLAKRMGWKKCLCSPSNRRCRAPGKKT